MPMKGTKVGSYIIEDKIGEGGMGVVYSAKHNRMNRPAVVKMLRKQLAESPEMARRFENEATAAASIGHPGIVQVFDVGQHEDGSLYIVMELLRGESLQDRLSRQGRLTVVQAISLVRQAAGALAAAHKVGIVHRDLKPDNMFVVPDPEVEGGERVKLLDFGIAKLADDGPGAMQTKTGAMMGTPHYMSPEQCQGAGGVDHRSDLYSLGCILFQLITGRTPFTGSGAGDFIVAHMTQAPPSLRSMAPYAPQALEDVVSTLLAKKPEERFGSADALVNALGHIRVDQGAVLGAQANAATEMAPASMSAPSSTAPASLGGTGAAPPQTTLGASTGQMASSMPPGDAAYSASLVQGAPAGKRSSTMRWSILGVLGVLALGGVAYGVMGREAPKTPAKAASLTAPADAGTTANDTQPPIEEGDAGPAMAGVVSAAEDSVPKPSLREDAREQRAQDKRAKEQRAQGKQGKAQSNKERLTKKAQSLKGKTEKSVAEVANAGANELVKAGDQLQGMLGGKKNSPRQTVEKSQAQPKDTSASDRRQIRARIPAIKHTVRACGRRFHVTGKDIRLKVTVGLNGRVENTKVSPPGLGPLANCIRMAAQQARFRPRLKKLTFQVPVRL